MTDQKKPRINVTRGKKKESPRSSEPEARKTKETESGGWLGSLSSLPTGLVQNAREVWLAGLGALSVVEDQGTKLFRALVEEGKHWEKERREETEAALRSLEAQGENVTDAATEALDEQVVRRVREGVDMALDRVGVPTRSALDDLREQVDDLAQKADRLAAQLEETEGD